MIDSLETNKQLQQLSVLINAPEYQTISQHKQEVDLPLSFEYFTHHRESGMLLRVAMSKQQIITGIDLGTDKCVTLITKVEGDKSAPQVLGVGTVASKGMRRSQIIDLEQVLETINESLDGAERMAGLEIKEAYLSVAGTHIASFNSKGVVKQYLPQIKKLYLRMLSV